MTGRIQVWCFGEGGECVQRAGGCDNAMEAEHGILLFWLVPVL